MLNATRFADQRRFILCADDFALHAGVDAAVLELGHAGRLSATSCMVSSPRWPDAAAALAPLQGKLQMGLHFNLTESHDGRWWARPLTQVIAMAYSRRWSVAEMRTQWRHQLEMFEQVMGVPPDFVDGHQHVHQLPVVQEALAQELVARYVPVQRPWVRSTRPAGALWRHPKAAVLGLLGGWTSSRRWSRAGLQTNSGFAGVYGFDAADTAAYGRLVAQWLRQMEDGALMMCHPATFVYPADVIGQQRWIEFSYLMSDAFGSLLSESGWQLQSRA